MKTKQLEQRRNKRGCLQITVLVLGVACLTSILTIGLAKYYLFPQAFIPVTLNAQERVDLDSKIKSLTAAVDQSGPLPDTKTRSSVPAEKKNDGSLKPERYRETDSNREISFTERELNALLANNKEFAEKLVIDLSNDLASVKLLFPLDPQLPIFGGKTVKLTAGIELRYTKGRPVAILRGVSIWGIPIPSAWMGKIKNIDLFREFGMDQGFWNTLAAGVADIQIADSKLFVKLKP